MRHEPLDAFSKSARFAPANEFRIALMGGEDVGMSLHLDIGDLNGIAEIVATMKLVVSRLKGWLLREERSGTQEGKLLAGHRGGGLEHEGSRGVVAHRVGALRPSAKERHPTGPDHQGRDSTVRAGTSPSRCRCRWRRWRWATPALCGPTTRWCARPWTASA